MAEIFTGLQILWAVWWLWLHMHIRRDRAYATGRSVSEKNPTYRLVSPFLYIMQKTLCVATFWSNQFWLLKFHDSDFLRFGGFGLFLVGSILYRWALKYLGANYSPCYDSHLPVALVKSGPYRRIRHPMYTAKLLIGVATLMVSGSWWFVPTTVYLFWVTVTTMLREDEQLTSQVPGYASYRARTHLFVPWII